MRYDFLVIGGGILGLATARQLLRVHAGATVALLEKEATLGTHQTGHNSGVIHAGVYYAPGSLKATLCRAGAAATKAFCRAHDIPFETRGKLIVATNDRELSRLDKLLANAKSNEIAVEAIDAGELKRREPNIVGVGAIYVKDTGIVDYQAICRAMAREIKAAGGEIVVSLAVTSIRETGSEVEVIAGDERYAARRLVACAGLQSDRLARMAGLNIEHRIVPFRGEYFDVRPEKRDIVKHLIYPTPDPDLPFLGIHLTPMIDGGLTVGPNAVLAFSREGYAKYSTNLRDISDYVRFSGFWRLARQNWRSGLNELSNSVAKARYLDACRKYCPSLELSDLKDRPAGIRAQAVLRDGTLVHDFLFTQSARSLHVGNAPSPAATSALPIAEMIVERISRQA